MSTVQAAPVNHHSSRPRIHPLDIVVLSGGPGPEREVSLESGRNVAEALRRIGHHVELRDIHPSDMTALDIPMDLTFIALHGEFGEDGTLQRELERRGIPFSGSGSAASGLAMNKVSTKRRLVCCGLPTPLYAVVHARCLTETAANFPLPAVVKPISSGSSVDTSIVRDRKQFGEALSAGISKYGEMLVEAYVHGLELTVGVLGDQALPVCEIRTQRDFYDYEAKYVDDSTQYLFDSDLPASLRKQTQTLALAAHQALGCEVISRVDIMVDRASLEPFILEINTIPGFTAHSLVPKAAARIGISFDELCQRIIDLSLARKQR